MSNNTELVLELLRFVSILVLACGSAESVQQFTVHRMQQLDIGSSSFGSRVGYINMEVRSELAPILNRRCVFVKWEDLTSDKFDSLLERGTGALIVVLPRSLSNISSEEKLQWMEMERVLLLQDIKIPLYFVTETDELLEVMDNVNGEVTDSSGLSVFSGILGMFQSYGYYVTTQGSEPKPMSSPSFATMQGLLKGQGITDQLPTVAIVTHYDAFGISTGHCTGADSNASGVAALLELSRLFSKLYNSLSTKPHYNLLFLVTSGGKLSYFGSKKWLEENTDGSDNSWILSNVKFFVCLDSLGNKSKLHLHVAKVPKEGSPLAQFAAFLNKSSLSLSSEDVNLVHKKIRRADDLLAWEHEQFALSRRSAVTLSHHRSHSENSRHSIFDDRSSVDVHHLLQNVHIIAEAIGGFIYNISTHNTNSCMTHTERCTGQLFQEERAGNEDKLRSYMTFLTSDSRSQQVLTVDHPIVQFISQTLSKFTLEKKLTHSPNKDEAEFTFYDMTSTELQIFSVKPPIFDLFLALLIAVYIGIVFLAIQNFQVVLFYFRSTKSKST